MSEAWHCSKDLPCGHVLAIISRLFPPRLSGADWICRIKSIQIAFRISSLLPGAKTKAVLPVVGQFGQRVGVGGDNGQARVAPSSIISEALQVRLGLGW